MATSKNTTRKKKDPMDPTEKQQLVSEILRVNRGRVEVCVLGTSGLMLNRLSNKTKFELLIPPPKKTGAERAVTLKHQPYVEFNAAPNTLADGPTLLALPATAFKGALSTAALDLPGQKKAQIGRLTFVVGEYVPIWGIPRIDLRPVRSADMKHTPDIRTRPILPRWAARFTVSFVQPLIKANQVAALVAAGGQYIGVGDGRPEKGKLVFGLFDIVPPDDPDFLEVVATGGREAQIQAMASPIPYNEESAELLSWFDEEIDRRRKTGGNTGTSINESESEQEEVMA